MMKYKWIILFQRNSRETLYRKFWALFVCECKKLCHLSQKCWHKFIFSFIPKIAVMTVYIQFSITYIARIYHSFKPNIFHAMQVCMVLCMHIWKGEPWAFSRMDYFVEEELSTTFFIVCGFSHVKYPHLSVSDEEIRWV